jgi:uncharacterized membrane protein
MAYGLSRRSIPGALLAAAALPLAYRAYAGRWPSVTGWNRGLGNGTDARDALAGGRGLHVRESVRVERPPAEVYRFWRRFENLPRFMMNLESVTELGNGRSHWIAKGPAGVRVEWDAEIINEVENKVIGWRTLPGADVVTAGSVNFDAGADGRSTLVSVHLQYAPPAGRLGGLVAAAVGREPSQMIREDLNRLKQLLETAESTRTSVPDYLGSHR